MFCFHSGFGFVLGVRVMVFKATGCIGKMFWEELILFSFFITKFCFFLLSYNMEDELQV